MKPTCFRRLVVDFVEQSQAAYTNRWASTLQQKGIEMLHTVDEDFEHFLSYSNLRNEPKETRQKMYLAFNAAWEPNRMTIDTAMQVAARIWCDQEYSHVAMNPSLCLSIARMLCNEANLQAAQQIVQADADPPGVEKSLSTTITPVGGAA